MGWDFSTEPEFQKKLDWVGEFCRDEVEPLDVAPKHVIRSQEMNRGLVGARALWISGYGAFDPCRAAASQARYFPWSRA